MMRSFSLTALVVGMLVAPGVQAQTHKPTTAAASSAPVPAAKDIAAETFKQWDKNGDGQLSLPEFRAGWQQAQATAQLQMQLRRQFATLDSNHDGAIDASEYGNLVLIKNAGKNAPPLARFDANADGKLEFGEYLKLVETLAPKESAKGAAK